MNKNLALAAVITVTLSLLGGVHLAIASALGIGVGLSFTRCVSRHSANKSANVPFTATLAGILAGLVAFVAVILLGMLAWPLFHQRVDEEGYTWAVTIYASISAGIAWLFCFFPSLRHAR